MCNFSCKFLAPSEATVAALAFPVVGDGILSTEFKIDKLEFREYTALICNSKQAVPDEADREVDAVHRRLCSVVLSHQGKEEKTRYK